MKTCTRCQQQKPLEEFYRSSASLDGQKSTCKACEQAYQRSPEYRKMRRKYKKNYRAIPENAQKHRDRAARSKKEHPERHQAHRSVEEAVKKGILIKPAVCDSCRKVTDVVGHHKSYEKNQRLVVDWLCRECHASVHRDVI